MLEAKGLLTVEDLLAYLPLRYEDRSNLKPISQLAPGEMATVIAEVKSAKVSGFKRRNLGLFEAYFTDGSGETLNAKWFHGAYLRTCSYPDMRVALFGKIEFDSYTGELQVMHPEFESLSGDDEDGEASCIPAVSCRSTRQRQDHHAHLSDRCSGAYWTTFRRCHDPLPESIFATRLKLPDRTTAVHRVHFPSEKEDLRLLNSFRSQAQFRMIFEEFFWLETRPRAEAREGPHCRRHRVRTERSRARADQGDAAVQAHRRAEAGAGGDRDDMAAPHPMNRLLQGDVGSGKTLVAAEAAIIAIENGYQVAVLAPTEILAAQHYFSFQEPVSEARLCDDPAHRIEHAARKDCS